MRIIRSMALCLAAALVAAGFCNTVFANATATVKVSVESFTLPNGMLFLVVNRPDLPQVACRLTIRAGSTFESAGNTGIAHMLEHMLFKGTKNFGTTDLKRDLELQKMIEAAYQSILSEQNKTAPNQAKIEQAQAQMAELREQARNIFVPNVVFTQLGKNGAININAMTSYDFTMYTSDVPADMLEQWFSLMSEQIFEPVWREFYVEKDVVLREWAYRSANDPGSLAMFNFKAAAYQASPYKNPVIGWLSDIERFSTMAAIAFHSKYYSPNNAICVLVGDVDVKEAQRLANIYFKRYPKGEDVAAYVTREPKQLGLRTVTAELAGAKTPLVFIGFHGPELGSADFYALDLLSMVLSNGQSSRFNQNLINTGLMTGASAFNPDSRFATNFMMVGVPALKSANGDYDYAALCQEAQNLLLNEIAEVIANGITEKELARAQTMARRQFIDTLRSNDELAYILATYEVYIGYTYLNTYLSELAKITAQDVQRAAAKFLTAQNMTVSVVLPGGDSAETPVEYHETREYKPGDERGEYMPPNFDNHSIYKTPAGWRHPLSFLREPELIQYQAAEEFTVNGVRVFYLKDESVPLAEMKILVKAGSVDVADDKQGLNRLLESVLIQGGTKNHSPQQLAEIIDDNAMQISVNSAKEQTAITVSVLSDTFEYSLNLLSEILTAPALHETVFNAAIQQALAGLHMDSGDAQWLAFNAAPKLFFGDGPYGRDALDQLQTLPNITPDDVRAFINSYFTPENMTIAFAGNVERAEVERLLTRFTAGLPQKAAPARNVLNMGVGGNSGLYLMHKPGQVQSQIVLMLPGVKRENPDYWKLNLLATLYGVGSESLLVTRLRDDLGLVYSSAFWETENWQNGYFMGWIGSKGAGTGLAIREALSLMEGLKAGVKEEEVKRTQLKMLNGFVFNLDNKFDLAATYAGYALRGAPMDMLTTIQEAFRDATAAELTELAQRFFDINKMQIVVVADKNTEVTQPNGETLTVLEDLRKTAASLGLTFTEM